MVGASPASAEVDVPWWGWVTRGDGTVVISVGAMWKSGVFYRRADGPPSDGIAFGGSLAEVVGDPTLGERPQLSEHAIQQLLIGGGSPTSTPFTGVHRLPPGHTLEIPHHGSPRVHAWLADSLPTDQAGTDLNHYRKSFNTALDHTLQRTAEAAEDARARPVLAMSSGLDSTYLAARWAQLADLAPLTCLVHVPLDGTTTAGGLVPRRYADEGPLAKTMGFAYPGRLLIETLTTAPDTDPLSVSGQVSRDAFFPAISPANLQWLSQLHGRAGELGAASVVSGSRGNWAFSFDRHQRPGRAEIGSRTARLRRILARRTGRGHRRGGQADQAHAIVAAVGLPNLSSGSAAVAAFQAPDGATTPNDPRDEFLRGLTGRRGAFESMWQSQAFRGIGVVDPFSAAGVVRAAAAIPPAVWTTGGDPRGFARELGRRLVPTEIRLNPLRGQQAGDVWALIHASRSRYLAAADEVAATPILSHWLDHRRLVSTISAWPWGNSTESPDVRIVYAALRVLAFAEFIRWADAMESMHAPSLENGYPVLHVDPSSDAECASRPNVPPAAQVVGSQSSTEDCDHYGHWTN